MAELDPEDAKLVTLARSARGRTGAADGTSGDREEPVVASGATRVDEHSRAVEGSRP